MSNRHKDFDKLLAEKLTNLNFAQAYITNLLEEEKLSLNDALREVIKAMGLQEFADRAGLSIQYVSDFVNGRKNFTTGTTDRYLQKVFKLKVKISVEVIKDVA